MRTRHKYEDFKDIFTREEFYLMMKINDLLQGRYEISKEIENTMNELRAYYGNGE
jgi:hypothetical protein